MQEFQRNHTGVSQESIHFCQKNTGNRNSHILKGALAHHTPSHKYLAKIFKNHGLTSATKQQYNLTQSHSQVNQTTSKIVHHFGRTTKTYLWDFLQPGVSILAKFQSCSDHPTKHAFVLLHGHFVMTEGQFKNSNSFQDRSGLKRKSVHFYLNSLQSRMRFEVTKVALKLCASLCFLCFGERERGARMERPKHHVDIIRPKASFQVVGEKTLKRVTKG